jgi:hypothetical protein
MATQVRQQAAPENWITSGWWRPVIVSGCHPGDCHYSTGNYYARRRFALFSKFLGIDEGRVTLLVGLGVGGDEVAADGERHRGARQGARAVRGVPRARRGRSAMNELSALARSLLSAGTAVIGYEEVEAARRLEVDCLECERAQRLGRRRQKRSPNVRQPRTREWRRGGMVDRSGGAPLVVAIQAPRLGDLHHLADLGEFGPLARHLRFLERSSRKIAPEIFHSMVAFGAGAERKQAFLSRLVGIANELFAMAASVSRARAHRKAGRPEAERAARMADHFCLRSRRKVRALFGALWSNDDEAAYLMGRAVLAGDHAWMEKSGMGLGLTVEELRPPQPAAAPARPPPEDEQRPLPPAPTAVPAA